jgi:hypothetical protein
VRLSAHLYVSPTDIDRVLDSEMTLGLGDFTLYRLRLGHGRFVAGFAQACNIGPDTFQEMARVG